MIDSNALVRVLIQALLGALPDLIKAAADGFAAIASAQANGAWDNITQSVQQSDGNFLSRTPPALSYNLGAVFDLYSQFNGVFLGVGALSCVVAGLSAVGRACFGWSWSLGEWGTRFVLGLMLGMSAPRFYQITIDLNNKICDAIIGVSLPSIPTGISIDPISLAIIAVIYVVLGFRLLVRLGYRLVFLDVLLIVGPLGLAAWAIPGGEPYARDWMKRYVGLLLGQDLVAVAMRVAGVMLGSFGGSLFAVALGVGLLLLAYDLATLFAEIRGGGLGSVIKSTVGVARALV